MDTNNGSTDFVLYLEADFVDDDESLTKEQLAAIQKNRQLYLESEQKYRLNRNERRSNRRRVMSGKAYPREYKPRSLRGS